MQIGKNLRGKSTYLVFCHGSHDEFRLIDVNLQEYNPKTKESSAPNVKKTFAELLTHRFVQIGIYGYIYDEFRLIDVNLQEYNPKTKESSAPNVKKIFAELLTNRFVQIGIYGILT